MPLLWGGGDSNGAQRHTHTHTYIPSKDNMSLLSMLAAAHMLRLDLSVHISRAEGRPVYSVGPCAQVISFSLKHMMASEIKYQKVKLCQNPLKKPNKLCLFDFFNNMTSHINTSQAFSFLKDPEN